MDYKCNDCDCQFNHYLERTDETVKCPQCGSTNIKNILPFDPYNREVINKR